MISLWYLPKARARQLCAEARANFGKAKYWVARSAGPLYKQSQVLEGRSNWTRFAVPLEIDYGHRWAQADVLIDASFDDRWARWVLLIDTEFDQLTIHADEQVHTISTIISLTSQLKGALEGGIDAPISRMDRSTPLLAINNCLLQLIAARAILHKLHLKKAHFFQPSPAIS